MKMNPLQFIRQPVPQLCHDRRGKDYATVLLAGCLFLFCHSGPLAQESPVLISNDHVDLKIEFDPTLQVLSGIFIHNEERETQQTSEQAVFVVNESARRQLPSGTPFGMEGDSLWILSQAPEPGHLALGVSAEDIPTGVFVDPLELRLVRVQGPGHFFAWQTDSPGVFDVKLNSADGIGAGDKVLSVPGSHEHMNWGFSQPGIYAIDFEAAGTLSPSAAVLKTPTTRFTFHVLPLPVLKPVQAWQRKHWKLGAPESDLSSDPDRDGIVNLAEYAFGLDPLEPSTSPLVEIRFSAGESRQLELVWARNTGATDVEWWLESRPEFGAPSKNVKIEPRIEVPHLTRERVTIRPIQVPEVLNRQFYRIAATLKSN